jgi:hypothetical protein
MKMTRVSLVLLVAASSTIARAQVQTTGSEAFNKIQIGVHPLGFQVGFGDRSPTGYKLTGDLAGLIAPLGSAGSVWIGGGLNYTYGFTYCINGTNDCGHDLQLWAFVMMTFEKAIKIPLVPFARAGVGGDVLIYNAVAGAFAFRVGGGVHYYLLKWLGLGVETNFTVGPGFYPNGLGTHLYGSWDLGLGARFAF